MAKAKLQLRLPRSVRSLQVFIAVLSFVCGLATAMVWIV